MVIDENFQGAIQTFFFAPHGCFHSFEIRPNTTNLTEVKLKKNKIYGDIFIELKFRVQTAVGTFAHGEASKGRAHCGQKGKVGEKVRQRGTGLWKSIPMRGNQSRPSGGLFQARLLTGLGQAALLC